MMTTRDTYHPAKRLEDVFETQVIAIPAATAIHYQLSSDAWSSMTYSDLNLWANTIASQIIAQVDSKHSSSKEVPFVALCLSTGPHQLASILGTLKSGHAYVPIDPTCSASRLNFILQDTAVRCVLTESKLMPSLKAVIDEGRLAGIQFILVDNLVDKLDNSLLTVSKPSPIAYMIYTSGSSGLPKGVVVSHQAILSYLEQSNTVLQAKNSDTWLQFSSYTFDASVEEMFLPISVGAKIVLRSESMMASFEGFLKAIKQVSVTVASIPTTYWHHLTKYVAANPGCLPQSLRMVVIGGEAGMMETLLVWEAAVQPPVSIVNAYGPTETTVTCSFWKNGGEVQNNINIIPLGRPLPDLRFYILDPVTLQRVSAGNHGILFVSGQTLSSGYHNAPDLTNEKFIINPFLAPPDVGDDYKYIYNTGDIVYEDLKSVFHFVGRGDEQIQIRGYRVEITGIESCITSRADVGHAAVIVVSDQGPDILVAFVTPSVQNAPIDIEALQKHAKATLTSYEMPARFCVVEAMPLLPSGKIDRNALRKWPSLSSAGADVHDGRDAATTDASDQNLSIQKLATIWANVLGLASSSSILPTSNFFELGGHSMTLVVLASQLKEHFGRHVTARNLIEHLTFDSMAEYIKASSSSPPEGLVNYSILGTLSLLPRAREDLLHRKQWPLSRAQMRLWILQNQDVDHSSFYNDGFAITIDGLLDVQRLKRCLQTIICRHEILRVQYVETLDAKNPVAQIVYPFNDDLWSTIFEEAALNASAAQHKADSINVQPFDLFAAPVIRILLMTVVDDSQAVNEHILMVSVHHAFWDGWSDGVFLQELKDLYNGQDLPPVLSYLDFVLWDNTKFGSIGTEHTKALRDYLEGADAINMATDLRRPDNQIFSSGASLYFSVPAAVANSLRLKAKESVVPALITALSTVLHAYTNGQEDFLIGVPFANRTVTETQQMIGFFVNLLPLRVKIPGNTTLAGLYASICDSLVFLQENEVPVDVLAQHIGADRFGSRDSFSPVAFTFQDAPEGNLTHYVTFRRYRLRNKANKTDLVYLLEGRRDGSLSGEVEYNANLFDPETVQSLVDAFQIVLVALANDPSVSIHSLRLATSLPDVEPSTPIVSRFTTLDGLVQSIALRYPNRPAIVDCTSGIKLSYFDLMSKVNTVSNALQHLPLGGKVAVLLERSANIVVSQLGVNRAGLAWIPLDVGAPADRLYKILRDSHAACLITQRQLFDRALSQLVLPDTEVMFIEDILDTCDSVTFLARSRQSDIAYVIYTSGTTGTPKGVAILHDSITRFLHDFGDFASESEPLNGLLTLNVAFDGSISQIYPSLAFGGCLTIAKRGGEFNGEYIARTIVERAVTYTLVTPSLIRNWLDQQVGVLFPPHFRLLSVGGESVDYQLLKEVFEASSAPGLVVLNAYGPTEGTIYSTKAQFTAESISSFCKRARLPVGIPLNGNRLVVRNAGGNELPLGFLGEICIEGPCVALEYLNNPVKTSASFYVNGKWRGWKSGDLGRRIASGSLEVLGRADSQVKIRGHRVELGEIEKILHDHPNVQTSHVHLYSSESNSGGQTMAAYATLRSTSVSHAEETEKMSEWENTFNKFTRDVQSGNLNSIDLTADFMGWNSTFTRKPYPLVDMMEWRDTTIERIESFGIFDGGKKPTILEIGCGSGLLLLILASRTSSYVTLDVSQEVVSRMQMRTQALGLHHVRISCLAAHRFDEAIREGEQFDLIIMNSVSQYFPSQSYLDLVMKKAGQFVKPGGCFFVGDIRDHRLHKEFTYAAAMENSSSSDPIEYFDETAKKHFQNEELLIHPAYFAHLSEGHHYYNSANILLRRGWGKTEMNLFRYDAVLWVGKDFSLPPTGIKHVSCSDGATLEELLSFTTIRQPVVLHGLINQRILNYQLVSEMLPFCNGTFGDLLAEVKSDPLQAEARNPEQLVQDLSTKTVYTIVLSPINDPLGFCVVLIPRDLDVWQILRSISHGNDLDKSMKFTNDPTVKNQAKQLDSIRSSIHKHLLRYLPHYMIPDYLILLDNFPLTSSGKVDSKRLTRPHPSTRLITSETSKECRQCLSRTSALTKVESILLASFKHVLDVESDQICIHSSFFDLGGHSLLVTRATASLRQILGVSIPYNSIIRFSSVEELAKEVQALQASAAAVQELSPKRALTDGPNRPNPPHLQLICSSFRTPLCALFVIHAVGGNVSFYSEFAEGIQSREQDVVIYGLVTDPGRPMSTLLQMSEAYAGSIEQLQLECPIILLGWSYGGVIALAMEKVIKQSRVVLLDTPIPSLCRSVLRPAEVFTDIIDQLNDSLRLSLPLDDRLHLAETLKTKLVSNGLSWGQTPASSSFLRTELNHSHVVSDDDIFFMVQTVINNFAALVNDSTSDSQREIRSLSQTEGIPNEPLIIVASHGLRIRPGFGDYLGWEQESVVLLDDCDHDSVLADPRVLDHVQLFLKRYISNAS